MASHVAAEVFNNLLNRGESFRSCIPEKDIFPLQSLFRLSCTFLKSGFEARVSGSGDCNEEAANQVFILAEIK